jgi:hypothetical protein
MADQAEYKLWSLESKTKMFYYNCHSEQKKLKFVTIPILRRTVKPVLKKIFATKIG